MGGCWWARGSEKGYSRYYSGKFDLIQLLISMLPILHTSMDKYQFLQLFHDWKLLVNFDLLGDIDLSFT